MNKFKLLFTLLLVLFSAEAFAVTEFVSTVKSSGGDYASLSLAEAGLQSDITQATSIKVFSISAHAGTFTDGVAIDNGSGVSGVMVHANVSGTQVLIKSITGGTFASGNVVWVTANHAITATLSNNGDTPIIGIECYSMVDTTAVVIDGSITSATNYIHIYTPISERHAGVYTESKYVLKVANTTPMLVKDGHVRIDGLQFYLTASNAVNPRILQFYGTGGDTGEVSGAVYYLTNSIIRGHSSSQTGFIGVQFYETGTGTSTAYIYNNLFYDVVSSGDTTEKSLSVFDAQFSFYIYNNDFINSGAIGLDVSQGTKYVYNNIFSGNGTADCTGTPDNHDYNSTTRSGFGYTANSHEYVSKTFNFRNSGSSDWHLLPSDVWAKDLGTSESGTFTTDVDGQTRSGLWDIGFDEVMRTFFYSGEDWE